MSASHTNLHKNFKFCVFHAIFESANHSSDSFVLDTQVYFEEVVIYIPFRVRKLLSFLCKLIIWKHLQLLKKRTRYAFYSYIQITFVGDIIAIVIIVGVVVVVGWYKFDVKLHDGRLPARSVLWKVLIYIHIFYITFVKFTRYIRCIYTYYIKTELKVKNPLEFT